MEKSNFVDQIKIFCRSGHGGAGSKHFMRNKLTAMGGPDGGDGGRGAHIILKGNTQLWTLLHLRYFKNVLAEMEETEAVIILPAGLEKISSLKYHLVRSQKMLKQERLKLRYLKMGRK